MNAEAKRAEFINSQEYKEHPELFGDVVLARSSVKKVKDMIHSDEFKEYPHLFTPQVLAHSRVMFKKMPVLIKLAEKYGIDGSLTTSCFMKSPSQFYAIINYLIEIGQREGITAPLFKEGNLHPFFTYTSTQLKERFNIDLKELIKRYPFDEEKFLAEEGSKRCHSMK